MNDTDPDDDLLPPPPRRRFGRLRKVALWSAGVVTVVAFVVLGARWQVRRAGQQRLTEATARLDADEPGWRLEAVVAERKRNEPRPDENAALVVLRLADRLPREWLDWRNSDAAMKWWGRRQDSRRPSAEATAAARAQAPATALLRAEAADLWKLRAGAYSFEFAADPISTRLPHLDKARQVASLLQYDALLAALDNDPSRAVAAVRSMLAVARSVGDEPLLISQFVRIAFATLAAQTAARVLAWCEPTDGLADLQAELLAEAEVPWFRTGVRGERAMLDRMFRGLADGTIPIASWCVYLGLQYPPGPKERTAFAAYRPLLPGDHAKCLELLTAYHDAAKLPPHEQLPALKRVPLPKDGADPVRYVLTRAFVPACDKAAEAGLRCRAELLSAAVCIACERFRLKHGRWPHEPGELVPAFLPAVPASPFDGRPISYRVLPDRVAVYCFWADLPPSRRPNELPDEFRAGDGSGAGVGFRVWNPDRRGLPAEEPKNP